MDEASDHQTTDEAGGDDASVDIRLIWQSAPTVCARCKREIRVPRPVAKLGDELLCYHCLFPLLRPDWVMTPRRDKALPATPEAAILWLNEPGTCCRCELDLRTPGPVGLIPDGPVCPQCLEFTEPTLSWILRLAYAVRSAQGYWPGAPHHESKPPAGWSRGEERPDWRQAEKTGRWPSAILGWPNPHE
jgi:hypothetical protein